jgi:hypothetical protein
MLAASSSAYFQAHHASGVKATAPCVQEEQKAPCWTQTWTGLLKERSSLSKEFEVLQLISFQLWLLVAGEFSWLRESTSDKFAGAWRQDWEITARSLDFQRDR